MLRKWIPILLLAGLVLSACAPSPVLMKKEPASGQPMSGCRVKNLIPIPNPTVAALLPAVSSADHILGAPGAPITIVEYSDYT